MDQRKTKRPRSTTPTKGKGDSLMAQLQQESPPKKKSKSNKRGTKTKTNKRNRSNSTSGAGDHTRKNKGGGGTSSGMSTTATADGEMMSTLLSTFTKLEQSRFEAYQRVTFDSNVIEEWVAACISDRYGLYDNNSNNDQNNNSRATRPLQDLIAAAPGQAEDIGMVVGTLAKIYAQRLVSAAHQNQIITRKEAPEAAATHNNNNNNNNPAAAVATQQQQQQQQQPLQPRDIMRAYERRKREGCDPGFFLQPHPAVCVSAYCSSSSGDGNSSFFGENGNGSGDGGIDNGSDGVGDNISRSNPSAVLKNTAQEYDTRRLAALAAQDAYDKHIAEAAANDKEEEGGNEGGGEVEGDNNNNNNNTSSNMEVDG